MARALLLIDLSCDFIDLDGALNCGTAGQAIVPYCTALVQAFVERGDLVIDVRDSHSMHDFEIKSGLFPPHNLAGTAGQQLIHPLRRILEQVPAQWLQISKKHYNAMFDTGLAELLTDGKIDEIHVVGVCTDICVRYTVNGLYEYKTTSQPGLRIMVHAGGVASFNPAGHADSLAHFPGAFGVQLV